MKLTMPKQYGGVDRNLFLLKKLKFKVQLQNSEVQKLMKNEFLQEKSDDASMLNKQDELARYFGLIDYLPSQKIRTITKKGLSFLDAHEESNNRTKQEIIENTITDRNFSFGKDNCAVPRSESILQPPVIFLRLIQELGSISIKEFGYALVDENKDFQEIIDDISEFRWNESEINIPEEYKNKFNDPKFPKFLEEIGVLVSTKSGNTKIYFFDEFNENLPFYKLLKKTPTKFNGLAEQIFSNKESDEKDILILNNRVPKSKSNTSNSWHTSKKIKEAALKKAKFSCEINQDHETFPREDGNKFMEGHHVIPMSAQSDFDKINLDQEINIASLCPTCHRSAHFAEKDHRKKIFEKLFMTRREDYLKLGINENSMDIFNKFY